MRNCLKVGTGQRVRKQGPSKTNLEDQLAYRYFHLSVVKHLCTWSQSIAGNELCAKIPLKCWHEICSSVYKR